MNVFWVLQGSIAAVGAASFLALGGACSSTSSGTGTGTGTGTWMGTGTGTDSCITYTSTSTDTCGVNCVPLLSGHDICPGSGPAEDAFMALLACASAKCASECPGFVGCNAFPTDDAACSPCLQTKCAAEVTSCTNN